MEKVMGEKIYGQSTLGKENAGNEIIANSAAMLQNADFNDYYVEQFTSGVTCILNDYADILGEGMAVRYSLAKKYSKIELRMWIRGEAYDVFKNGSEARKHQFESLTGLSLNQELVSVSYKYESESNVITVSLPLLEKRKPFYKNALLWAIVLGVALGFVCQALPDSAKSFIIDDVASPVQSVVLSMISGIMGPIVFISITSSIIALENINDLTHLAFRVLKRFVLVILFIIVLSIAVSAFFFTDFGTADISFDPSYLIDLVLSIFPTNVIEPFLNTNIPQLVILGILLGAALLILGDKAAGVKDLVKQLNQCVRTVMNILLRIIPLIPFLSLLTTIGSGKGSEILQGWKFIVAVYIVFTIAVAFKAVKTSLVTGIRIPDLWRKLSPIVVISFTTGSNAAPMKKIYEISEEELGIKPEFTSFWIPMCAAMMSIKTTVYLILATLMVAELGGTALTTNFLFTMIFVTLVLSLASPGAASSWTIMFQILGMSTDYVGIFSIYRVASENYSTASTMAYSMLEQVEAAYRLGGMKDSPEITKGKRRLFGKKKEKRQT